MAVTIDAPVAPATRWRRAGPIVIAALCLFVLGTSVYGSFDEVRIRLLSSPAPAQTSISLPLTRLQEIADPYVAFIVRLRNSGAAAAAVSTAIGPQVLNQVSLEPGAAQRIDIVVPRSVAGGGASLDITGTAGGWSLDYVEMANLHGFTRGVVEFLILPEGQPFPGPAIWLFSVWGVCALLMLTVRPLRLPRWIRAAHAVVAGVVVLLFAATAAVPVFSAFRIALAPHTFAGGTVILAAPHLLRVIAWALHVRVPRTSVVPRTTVAGGLQASAQQTEAAGGLQASGHPWLRITLATAVLLFVVLIAARMGAYAGGADQSGYLNSARLLAAAQISTPMRVVPGVPADLPPTMYMPLGFRTSGSDTLVPTYPMGLPILVAAVAPFVGWDAASHVTMVLHAVAGVILMLIAGRMWGLSLRLAAVGVLLLASSPLYLFMSLTLMSDVPALVWTAAAVLLAWHSRQQPRWAFACGMAVAVAVLIRPTNILVIAPIAICLGLSPARWAWLIAGGVPGAVLLVSYNLAAYDAAVTTGYGDYTYLFTLENVPRSLTNYRNWLPVHLTPFGLLALGLPALLRRMPREAAVLLVWSGVFLVFYAFYYFTFETWWYLRFVLPAFPPLIVGALLVARQLAARAPSWAHSAAVALLAVGVLAHNVWWNDRLDTLDAGTGEQTYFRAAQWSRANLPPNAVIVCMQVSGSFFYYTDFPIVRWDMFSGEEWSRLRADLMRRGQPVYAVLFPYEADDMAVLTKNVPGTWARAGGVDHIRVWQLTADPAGPR